MITQAEAIALCREIEAIAPKFGAHVALTGGALYKDGERKDADILLYRIRQVPQIDVRGLIKALEAIGINEYRDFGWCIKCGWYGRAIDLFFPERADQGLDQDPEYDGL